MSRRNTKDFSVIVLIFLAGFAAAIGQILVLRELLVLFYGNELSAGLILACWLLCTAAGSFGAGRIRFHGKTNVKALLLCYNVMSLALPPTIAWIRATRLVWSIPPGEMIAPGSMILIAISSIGPFCVLSGAVFAIAWRLSSDFTGEEGALPVYLAEATGSAVGGLVFYFLLLPFFPALRAGILLCLFLLASSCLVYALSRTHGKGTALFCISAMLLTAVALGYSTDLDRRTRGIQWGKAFAASRDTPYRNLCFIENADQFSLFSNGLWLHSLPDPQTAEQAAHLPLLEHPNPVNILVIGDFSPELLRELEKNGGVKRIDCVQPDEAFVAFDFETLPPSVTASLTDPRVRLLYIDPNRYAKTVSHNYDVVILQIGEPVNAATNRFYTVEFFSRIKSLLAEGGVFSFTAPAAPDIVGPREAALLRSLYRTLKAAFSSVMVFPGDSAHFFASGSDGSLTRDPETLARRLVERGLDLRYVRDYYLADCLSPFRLAYMDSVLDGTGPSGVNRDFEPVCYLYTLGYWGAQVHPVLGRFFASLSGQGRSWHLAALALLVSAVPFLLRVGFGAGAVITFNTALCGASLILFEILLILVFQVLDGSMYRQLALIVSLVMAGLAAGGALARKAQRHDRLRHLSLIQAGFAAYAGFMMAALILLQEFPEMCPASGWILLFTLLPALLAGILGGAQFSLAVAAKSAVSPNRRAGTWLYAADLAGAAAGALAGSLLLIPLLGIPRTLCLLMLGCLAGSLALAGKGNTLRA